MATPTLRERFQTALEDWELARKTNPDHAKIDYEATAVYFAQQGNAAKIQADLNKITEREPVSDDEREAEIRESCEDTEESWDSDKFLLRKLDEARAEMTRLQALIPAQLNSTPVLSGPFWKTLSDAE